MKDDQGNALSVTAPDTGPDAAGRPGQHGSQPRIEPFFHAATSTVSYVVYDRDGGSAAIIDPVLDYDSPSARTATASADGMVRFVRDHSLALEWILETHAHADHLSAALHLRRTLGGKLAIGRHIGMVQSAFKNLFNFEPAFPTDGSQFDHLFDPDELFNIGSLQGRALCVPGHTPADMAYQVGDAVFVGDTLFMPDVGTARCDFPGGDARTLYRSLQKLLSLPDNTRLFMCHDYAPAGREPQWQSTVGEQRRSNIHVHDGITEDDFVRMREARDATLAMPSLIIPSIQVNIRAGAFPEPEENGVAYLKVPLNVLGRRAR